MSGSIRAGTAGLLAHIQARLASECGLIGALPAPAYRTIESLIQGATADMVHGAVIGIHDSGSILGACLGRVRYELRSVCATAGLPVDYEPRLLLIVCESIRAGLATLVPALVATYHHPGESS